MIPTNNIDDDQPQERDWFIIKFILISVAVGAFAGMLIEVLN